MAEDPKDHPEWFNRDARIAVMDEQGVEAVWMFPSQGVCMEGPMQPDVEAILDIFRGFNRWIDDEWGFAYKNRIFAAPYLTLSDLDLALGELAWVLDRGARVVALRPGPVFTPRRLEVPRRSSVRFVLGPGQRGPVGCRRSPRLRRWIP